MSLMKTGDDEVLTLNEAAEMFGLSLRTLSASPARETKGKSGFAAPSHPLHGKRGGGGPPKKTDA